MSGWHTLCFEKMVLDSVVLLDHAHVEFVESPIGAAQHLMDRFLSVLVPSRTQIELAFAGGEFTTILKATLHFTKAKILFATPMSNAWSGIIHRLQQTIETRFIGR